MMNSDWNIKTLRGRTLDRLRDKDEEIITALAERALSNIQHVWPADEALSEEQVGGLRDCLHWLFHLGREAACIGPAACAVRADGRDTSAHLGSAAVGCLIACCVLMSIEMPRRGSAFIECADRIPDKLDHYIDPRTDKSVSWFDVEDVRIGRLRACPRVYGDPTWRLAHFECLANAFLKGLDWLVTKKRPSRRVLRDCLRYLHAWAVELCAAAVLLGLRD